MGKELLVKLFEHIASVIDHGIAGKPVEFHDGIRKFCTAGNDPGPEDLKTVVFHNQSKLGAVPCKTLDHLLFVGRRFQVGGSKFILDVRIKFHRSEEHTSELQSQSNIVCRLLLEKKK